MADPELMRMAAIIRTIVGVSESRRKQLMDRLDPDERDTIEQVIAPPAPGDPDLVHTLRAISGVLSIG